MDPQALPLRVHEGDVVGLWGRGRHGVRMGDTVSRQCPAPSARPRRSLRWAGAFRRALRLTEAVTAGSDSPGIWRLWAFGAEQDERGDVVLWVAPRCQQSHRFRGYSSTFQLDLSLVFVTDALAHPTDSV